MQIVEWNDELMRLSGSPGAPLDRAVTVGEPDGPWAGLAPWQSSTRPCPATPLPRRTCTSVTVTQ